MLEWLLRFTGNKELRAPFVVKNDSEYYKDLRKRFTYLNKLMENVAADKESRIIVKKYGDKICDAIRDYYKGHVSTCHQKIENLIKDCSQHPLAVSELNHSRAFPGAPDREIQFFRARCSSDAKTLAPIDMLHLPFYIRRQLLSRVILYIFIEKLEGHNHGRPVLFMFHIDLVTILLVHINIKYGNAKERSKQIDNLTINSNFVCFSSNVRPTCQPVCQLWYN